MVWGALLEVKLRLAIVLRNLYFNRRVWMHLARSVLAVKPCC